MPEIWAYCDRCARWFYCPKQHRASELECPACAIPARVSREGRPPAPAAPAQELPDPAERTAAS